MKRFKGNGMRTYKQLLKFMNEIPYGIPKGDKWTKKQQSVDLPGPDNKKFQYQLHYRDVSECIRFLLGYEPFAPELAWAPVRLYHGDTEALKVDDEEEDAQSTDNQRPLNQNQIMVNQNRDTDREDNGGSGESSGDEQLAMGENNLREDGEPIGAQRLYNEMYTGDWWWEMQEKLPDGATVVPVILGTDKTQMTKLHGDVMAWPVYITIGNLSRSVRRKQTYPSKLLLGFLPIVKAVSRKTDAQGAQRIKAKVYHDSMRAMLKRKLSWRSKYTWNQANH